MNNTSKIEIYDCGCVVTRPKEQSCRSFGTRWRAYTSLSKDGSIAKLLLKCRDCGRLRHFVLTGKNPAMIQYMDKEEGDEQT